MCQKLMFIYYQTRSHVSAVNFEVWTDNYLDKGSSRIEVRLTHLYAFNAEVIWNLNNIVKILNAKEIFNLQLNGVLRNDKHFNLTNWNKITYIRNYLECWKKFYNKILCVIILYRFKRISSSVNKFVNSSEPNMNKNIT